MCNLVGVTHLRETYCLHPKHRNAYILNLQCAVSGSHASVVEDSGLLGYNIVSIDKELLMFSTSLLPPFSGSVKSKNIPIPGKCWYLPVK